MAHQNNGAWIGFLACAFAVVGLTGLFATYAAPLPLLRGEQREAAFDAAMQAKPSDLQALRPALGEDADPVIAAATNGPPAKLFELRAAMRQRFQEEADAVADRQRLLIGVVTAAAALFGAALLGFGRSR